MTAMFLSSLSEINFLGANLVDFHDLLKLVVRFLFNFGVTLLIVKYIYYSATKRKDYLFTFILISTSIFLLCFLLDNVKLQLGFALGLFAIFGIIRYRTTQIPIKEMTYLFIVIGIAVINALSNKKISWAELVFTNLAIATVLYILEKTWFHRHETSKAIVYEKIELIKPENYKLLKADLEKRTGLNILRIEIGKIDFLKDTARIQIYYLQSENNINYIDGVVAIDDDDDD